MGQLAVSFEGWLGVINLFLYSVILKLFAEVSRVLFTKCNIVICGRAFCLPAEHGIKLK